MLIFYTMGIAAALEAVQERINNSAVKVGRNPAQIKLVAVSKTVELQKIIEAVKAGVSILGENRVQEALKKVTSYELRVTSNRLSSENNSSLVTCHPLPKVEWHLIGHLQKNKAKYAVQLFNLIHTIDSISLAEEVNKQAEKIGKKQRVLVQVKLFDEAAKHGITEKYLLELLEKAAGMDYLKLEGLMTMPPFFENHEETRPYFEKLRGIRDEAGKKGFNLPELSMGMTNDFEVAIEESATIVRIGTAIFGERN